MDEKTLRVEIRGVLERYAHLGVSVDALSDDDDLFAAGMSSLKSVNVMLGLEDRFGVEFPNEMLTRATFESIDAIAASVGRLGPVPA